MDAADPIPPSAKALLELFANELKDVSFPGVDRAALEQIINDVRTHTEGVAKAEAALESARTALRESEELLSTKAQKGLAYARVYAEDRPEIVAKVDAVARIAGAAPSSPPARDRDASGEPPKRRGRPSKKSPAVDPAEATPAAPAVAPVIEPSAAPSDNAAKINGAAH